MRRRLAFQVEGDACDRRDGPADTVPAGSCGQRKVAALETSVTASAPGGEVQR